MPRWLSGSHFLGAVSVLGVAMLVWAFGPEAPGTGERSVGEGADPAPDFRLETIEGEVFHLKAHRGEVVVLNFWGTWCGPCRQEIPHLVSLQRTFGEEGLQVVGVALERGAGVERVRKFAKQRNINYPVGLGDGTIVRKYGGVRGVPTTIVIDAEGQIRGRLTGRVTEAMLRPGLKRLLKDAS